MFCRIFLGRFADEVTDNLILGELCGYHSGFLKFTYSLHIPRDAVPTQVRQSSVNQLPWMLFRILRARKAFAANTLSKLLQVNRESCFLVSSVIAHFARRVFYCEFTSNILAF